MDTSSTGFRGSMRCFVMGFCSSCVNKTDVNAERLSSDSLDCSGSKSSSSLNSTGCVILKSS
jgi:hypothetical protein